ncbi:hypothetical protein ABZ832_28610 [Streptantibioticus parmotrematis]
MPPHPPLPDGRRRERFGWRGAYSNTTEVNALLTSTAAAHTSSGN